MLKARVIPTLLHKDVGLVKGVRFASDRRVGAAMQAVKVYNRRGVDELVFFDVTATLDERLETVAEVDLVGDGAMDVAHVDRRVDGLASAAVVTGVLAHAPGRGRQRVVQHDRDQHPRPSHARLPVANRRVDDQSLTPIHCWDS